MKCKLEWEQNPSKNKMTWEEAKYYAKSLGSGWRLPFTSELKQAYTDRIPGFIDSYYWSSVTKVKYINTAWIVYFGDGSKYCNSKTNYNYTRCVRDV